MGCVVRTSAWYSLPVAISLRPKQKVRVLATKNSEYRSIERKREMAWLKSREVVKDLVIHENSFSLYSRKWKTPCMKQTETIMGNSNPRNVIQETGYKDIGKLKRLTREDEDNKR